MLCVEKICHLKGILSFMATKPITAVIVGGGHRSFIYADYSLLHPDELKIVGIADPDESRVRDAVKKYSIPEENCFSSADPVDPKGLYHTAENSLSCNYRFYFIIFSPLIQPLLSCFP